MASLTISPLAAPANNGAAIREGLEDSPGNDQWAERDAAVGPNFSRFRTLGTGEPVFVRGSGACLYDADGKEYVDFTSGFSVVTLGHGNPQVMAHAIEQLQQLAHCGGFPTPWKIRLAEKLAQLAPIDGPVKVYFSVGGSRAVEIAWKATAAFTGRPGLACFNECYHGRSLGTSLISNTASLPIVEPIAPVVKLAYPYCYRCPLGKSLGTCGYECVQVLERQLRECSPPVGGVIFEPALGARGYVFPPPEFFQLLRQAADELGLLLIDDEIQMGMGRTGSMFLCEHYGVRPDILLLSKSLGGGVFPISAVIGRADVLDAIPMGVESETFAANPLGASMGCFMLDHLREEKIIERSWRLGRIVLKRAQGWFDRFGIFGYAEGAGLAVGVEFVTDPLTKAPAADFTRRLLAACYKEGVALHQSGIHRNRITLIPPLTISRDDLELGLERIEQGLREAVAGGAS